MAQIIPTKAPALLLPPGQYDPRYHGQLVEALRRYFAQIDQRFQQLFLGFNNYAEFYNTATQNSSGAGNVNLVAFNTTEMSHGVSYDVGNPSRVTVTKNGVYSFNPALTCDAPSGGATDFHLWFRLNGDDLPYTGQHFHVTAATDTLTFAVEHLFPLEQGDYVELCWESPNANARLLTIAAAAPVPAIPSARMTVSYIFPADTV